MRILFRESDSRLVHTVFVVDFSAEFQTDGTFAVLIQDCEGDYWVCKSMPFDDFDEYAYHLAVNGFIDLRKYLFDLDVIRP